MTPFLLLGLHPTLNLFRRGGGYVFPLYLYPTDQDLDQSRRINFDPKLYARLQTLNRHPTHGTPDEVAVFDYIYGVLHCPAYRATYAEFLKIDFSPASRGRPPRMSSGTCQPKAQNCASCT